MLMIDVRKMWAYNRYLRHRFLDTLAKLDWGELVKDRKTKEPMAPWNSSSPEMTALRKFCLENGLFLYTHWHTVLVIPPLIITESQLQEGMEVLDKALEITDKASGQ